jgi:hypothetical protein
MTKIVLTAAVLGFVGGFAGLAMGQDKTGEALGSDVSSKCAHRRTMPPDPHDDCFRKQRSDAQVGFGQGSASASGVGPGNGGGRANGIGPGNGGGQGNGIGPGSGGGQGKGRQ